MNIRQILSLILSLGAILGAVSCSKKIELDERPDVLVSMGGESITLGELEAEAARALATGRPVISQKELLERLVLFKAQVLRAKALKLDQEPDVARDIEKILVNALRQRELENPEKGIAEEDLRKVYDQELAAYTQPAADRLSMLFLQIEKNASNEKRAEVHQRMAEAQAEAKKQPLHSGRGPSMQGFAQLSITHSDDQISRYRGGDIGWSNRGTSSARVPEDIWQAGVALNLGEVSTILESSDGLYLLKKTDFRPESVKAFEEVRMAIRKKMLAERTQKCEKDFFEACLTWAAPQVNTERVMRLTEKTDVLSGKADTAVSALGVPHE